MIFLYGIKACDTMKKARTWLDDRSVNYRFHDFKSEGLEPETLDRWVKAVGWEVLINRSGTTFRNLPDAERKGVDEAKAIRLMLAQPTMVKRPVLDFDGHVIVGFKAENYAAVLG